MQFIRDASGDLWVATSDGLLRRIKGKWINTDDNLMAYGLKRTYFSLENGTSKSTGILFRRTFFCRVSLQKMEITGY